MIASVRCSHPHGIDRLALACLCMLALATAARAQPSGSTALAWKLPAGSEHRLAFTQVTESVTSVNKYALRLKMEMRADLRWQVERVDEAGAMEIRQSIERIQLKMVPADGAAPIEFDSAAADRPRGAARRLAASLQPLVGLESLFRMSPRGEVLDAKLTEESASALAEQRQTLESEQVRSLFTADNLNEMLQQALALLPAESVAPGATWNSARDSKLAMGQVRVESQYTYRGPEASEEDQTLQVIDSVARVQLQPAADAPQVTLVEQQTAGTLSFDASEGKLAHSSLRQQLVTRTPLRDEQITVRLTSSLDLTFTTLAP